MRSKLNFICAIVQLIIGILAITAFVVLSISGENITKWVITLLLAITLVVIGVIGIIDYMKR